MGLSNDIRIIRQKCFMSQADFAKELGVAFSTVNRWENDKGKPNLAAMKSIYEFCANHNIDFSQLEEKWLRYGKEENNND